MTRTGAGARLSVAGSLLLLLLLSTGCQVALTAGVEAKPDGSGRVRAGIGLDEEALREIGDLSQGLRLDDLRQAGWEVSQPRQESDGLTWVRISKSFETVARAAQVSAELSGPEGPFRELRLERTRTFFKTRLRFTGLVDLSNGLAGLNDPALQERLGDANLALDLAGLQQRFGDALNRTVRVRVDAKLPGEVKAEGATPIDGGVSWQPVVGEQVQVSATSESWNVRPLVPALAALLFAVAGLVAVLVRRGGRSA